MENGDALYACIAELDHKKELFLERVAYKLFLEGKEFKARIAELEKKNEKLKEENEKYCAFVSDLDEDLQDTYNGYWKCNAGYWKREDDEDEEEEEEEWRKRMRLLSAHNKCWTCVEEKATHKEWRDALEEYELTCDVCHKNEYPESYEDEHEDEDEDEDKDKDKDKKDGNELSFLSLATEIINEAYRQQEESRLLSQ